MTWLIIAAVAAALLIFFILPALVMYSLIFSRRRVIPLEEYPWENYTDHYFYPYAPRVIKARDRLKKHPMREVETTAFDGVKLCADYYPQGSKRTAVLFHGYNAEVYTNCAAQAEFLYERGFNVLLVIHRAHGKSGGRHTGIGRLEQYDVLSWADYAEDLGAEEILLYGLSMGGSSVAYASDKLKNPKIKAMVIDSAFYSAYEHMRRDSKRMHIPPFALPLIALCARIFINVDIRVPTVKSLEKATVPALFIHGTADETVEPRWSKVNYNACASEKELLYVDGAPHTLSLVHNPELTGKKLDEFIGKYFSAEKCLLNSKTTI